MNSLRFWIVVLSATWFLAGLAVGAFWGGAFEGPELRSEGEHAAYEAAFVEQFDLGPERAALLAALLDNYSEEKELIRSQHRTDPPSAMEPKLRSLGRRYNDLIRDKILPADKRGLFDELALGTF